MTCTFEGMTFRTCAEFKINFSDRKRDVIPSVIISCHREAAS